MEAQGHELLEIQAHLRSMVLRGRVDDESVKGILVEVEAHQNQFSALSKRLIREFGGAEREDSITPASSISTWFGIQASLIPDKYKFEYESARKLAETVEGFLYPGWKEFLLYFHGISDTESDAIKKELRRAGLRCTVRWTFENALDAAILFIIPL